MKLFESFELKTINYKRINKSDLIEMFSNFKFVDVNKQRFILQWIESQTKLFAYDIDNYLIISVSDGGVREWHFLNKDYLDNDEMLDMSINAMPVLNNVFNLIYSTAITKGKSYRERIITKEKSRLNLYKKIVNKVIKKYNLQYEIQEIKNGFEMIPFSFEGLYGNFYKKQYADLYERINN